MRGWLMVFRCIAFCVLINHLKRLVKTLYAFGKIAFRFVFALLEPPFSAFYIFLHLEKWCFFCMKKWLKIIICLRM